MLMVLMLAMAADLSPVASRPPIVAVVPSAPPAPPRAPAVIRKPAWIRTPSASMFGKLYPPDALQKGIEGHAVMECQVTRLGTLTGCAVVTEQPQGAGFGAATLGLAPGFQMRPATVDGVPVAGAHVTIPVSWKTSG